MDILPYTTDTSAEALEVQLECMRRMYPKERIERMLTMSHRVRTMAFDAIRRRHPEFCEQEVRLKFIAITYGEELALNVRDFLAERECE